MRITIACRLIWSNGSKAPLQITTMRVGVDTPLAFKAFAAVEVVGDQHCEVSVLSQAGSWPDGVVGSEERDYGRIVANPEAAFQVARASIAKFLPERLLRDALAEMGRIG
jgi:hypothetical protein